MELSAAAAAAGPATMAVSLHPHASYKREKTYWYFKKTKASTKTDVEQGLVYFSYFSI